MSTILERGSWDTLSLKLEEKIRFNNAKSKDQKKTLGQIFKEFAEEYGTTEGSTRNYYYSDVKPKLDKKVNIDESIQNHVNTVRPEPQLRDIRNRIKIGEICNAKITSIHNFGAFVITDNGVEGLIHISEITKDYVDVPEDYFYLGEKVRVQVSNINKDGKVGFSTRRLGGKDKINPAFKSLSNKVIDKSEQIFKPIFVKEAVVENPSPVEPKPIEVDKDKDNLIQFIKKYSDNNVSQKALSDIDEMISKFGVFQTTLSLVETVRDLDISSFITEMTKDKLQGEYLRRNTWFKVFNNTTSCWPLAQTHKQ